MADGAFVLLQVALGAETDRTRLAPEWPLKVMDVHMEPQLGGLRKHFLADSTH